MYVAVDENVYLVGGLGLSCPEDCCVYLLNLREGILVDCGTQRGVNRILENIAELQIDIYNIKYLILTHCHIDHTGGAARLKEMLDLKIIAHEGDKEAIEKADPMLTASRWYNERLIPVEVDIVLKGERGILFERERDLEWIHIPGHTPGSIAILYSTSEKKILFAQDLHGPLSGEFRSNREDYKKSLKKMMDIEADILCEGHYGIIRGKDEVRDFIKQFLK